MKISPTTFENQLRTRTLDLLYSQWSDLGLPFSPSLSKAPEEVIDPEALVWGSLEFLPTEPRLREGVLSWFHEHGQILIRQRLRRVANPGEPRANIWNVVDGPRQSKQPVQHEPREACHGLESPVEVKAFCNDLLKHQKPDQIRRDWVGQLTQKDTTLLLKARYLLGSDARHLILVYLLATPSGALVRDIAAWSKYSYRSIAETVSRWEAAGVVATSHGFCRLKNPAPWRDLLNQQHGGTVVVDWFAVFDAVIRLLRAYAKANRKGIDADGAVLSSYRRETIEVLSAATQGDSPCSASVSYLAEVIAAVGAGD